MKTSAIALLLTFIFSVSSSAVEKEGDDSSFRTRVFSFVQCAVVRTATGASFGVTGQIKNIIALTRWENKYGDPCYGALEDTPRHRALGQQVMAQTWGAIGGTLGFLSCLIY